MTNNSNSNPRRRGTTAAGLGGLALASVLLLCGAGNAPIENFLPQGAMRADLNAGGHSLTNAATLSATNVTVSGALTATNFTLPFSSVTAKPTTVSGYGITDAETQAAADARYSPLAGSTNLTTLGAVSSGSFPYANLSGNPLSVAGGKTLTVSNTLTLAGTDGSTLNVGAGGALGAEAFDASAPTGAATAQTIGTTQTYTLARAGHNTSLQVVLQAGTGAYTANIALSDTGGQTGDLALVNVTWPSSTNPTLNFYNGSTGGTLLAGPLLGTVSGGSSTFQFEFNGTAWVHFNKGELDTRNLGTGVQTALGNAVNASGGVLSNTLGATGDLAPYLPSSGSVVVILGDSVMNGYGGAYPGKVLSTLPGWTTIPIICYAVNGTVAGPVGTSNSGMAILAATSPAYTKWINGAQTTGNAAVSSWTPTGSGIAYYFDEYGLNDFELNNSGASSVANFKSYLQSIYTTEHGYNAGSKVIGVTFASPADGQHPGGKANADIWNNTIRCLTATANGTTGAGYSDLLCDWGAAFGSQSVGQYTGDPMSSDGVHPTVVATNIYAAKMADAVQRNITLADYYGFNSGMFMQGTYGPNAGGFLSGRIYTSSSASASGGDILTNAGGSGAGGAILTYGTGSYSGGVLWTYSDGSANGGSVNLSGYSGVKAGSLVLSYNTNEIIASGSAQYVLTIPATQNDTFAELGQSQTFTGNDTFGGSSTFNGLTTFNGSLGASQSSLLVSSTPYFGGSGTTTLPDVLIQASGAIAVTSWSTNGTFLGINSSSGGFNGNFIDVHQDGVTSVFTVAASGATSTTSLVGIGLTPSIAAGSAAGTSPAVSLIGKATEGEITITTGTSPTASGTLATITFAASPGFGSHSEPSLTPENAAAAALSGTSMPYCPQAGTTNWTISSNTAALAASTTYVFRYTCTGY